MQVFWCVGLKLCGRGRFIRGQSNLRFNNRLALGQSLSINCQALSAVSHLSAVSGLLPGCLVQAPLGHGPNLIWLLSNGGGGVASNTPKSLNRDQQPLLNQTFS